MSERPDHKLESIPSGLLQEVVGDHEFTKVHLDGPHATESKTPCADSHVNLKQRSARLFSASQPPFHPLNSKSTLTCGNNLATHCRHAPWVVKGSKRWIA